MRLSQNFLLLMPQSPLPEVSRAGQGAMARTACRGAATGRVLPCGFHLTPTGRAAGAPEPALNLWHSLPCRRRNFIANRSRPEASRCQDRLFGGPAYLGTKPSSSSAPPLRRSWRRARVRPAPLDFVSPAISFPVKVLSRLFRAKFVAYLKTAFCQGELGFHGELKSLGEKRTFFEWLARIAETEWVVYAKPPFGGPRQVLKYLARYSPSQ